MHLPLFLFIEPAPNMPGAGFLLVTSPPFYIAKILKFKPDQATGQPGVFVPDYNICIRPHTSLLAAEPPPASLLEQMANYYLQQKILPNKPHYKKYLQQ